jgi:hypothetical protein
MNTSKLLLNAYVSDGLTLNGGEQRLIELANRMRLFAPRNVIDAAENVIRGLVEISLKPSVDLRKLTVADLSRNSYSDCHSARLAGRTWTTCTRPSPEFVSRTSIVPSIGP